MDPIVNNIWTELQPIVVNSAVAIVVALLGFATYEVQQFVNAKMNQKDAQFYLNMLNDVSKTVVDYLEQTVKPALIQRQDSDGQHLSKEAVRKILKNKAVDIIEDKISQHGQAVITKNVGDFTSFVDMKIEQGVQVRKVESGEKAKTNVAMAEAVKEAVTDVVTEAAKTPIKAKVKVKKGVRS